jgi:hypothetical protein
MMYLLICNLLVKRQIAQQQTTGKTSQLYQEIFENVKSCHLS